MEQIQLDKEILMGQFAIEDYDNTFTELLIFEEFLFYPVNV